jgi:hypothetical protein
MNRADVNPHPGPPPESDAVMIPVPVALGPEKDVTSVGVKDTVADAGPVPAELVAVTKQV